jgi:uncharacterized protein
VRRTVTLLAGVLLALAPAGPVVAAPAPATTPAGTVPAGGAPYPAPALCVDTARAMSAGACGRITRVLAADEKESTRGDQIAVAVVPTTGGVSIEDWSLGLFNAWGVGRAGTDNGVLLVVALEDRALRIATGDGLAGRFPDYRASEIIGSTITPLLRAGRTEDAVLAGVDAIRGELGHDVALRPLADGVDPLPLVSTPDEDTGGSGSLAWLWLLLLGGLGLAFWLSSLVKGEGWAEEDDGGTRRSYRPRRSFTSSSSSARRSSSSSRRSTFGGGRSSGGGASGRW